MRPFFPPPGQKNYFVVLVDIQEYLDIYDVAPDDLLLMIAAEFAHVVKEKADVSLTDSYFQQKFQEVQKLLFSDLKAEEFELPLWGAKAKVKFLGVDHDNRERVRAKLQHQTSTLLQEINNLFDRALIELKKKHYDDIVLILDNLEKIERLAGSKDLGDTHQKLFIENARILTNFNVHTIYTVPLTLARSHGPELGALYGDEPFVLPMVKVQDQDGSHFPGGWKRMSEMLERRLGPHKKNEIITQEALDWLIQYSGGNTRQFMRFVQNACLKTTDLPIPIEAARQAIRRTTQTFSAGMRVEWLEKLVDLHLSANKQVDNTDPAVQEMLRQGYMLEYVNGGTEHDVFFDTVPWYAVHPIVRELKPFRDALADRQRQESPNGSAGND